MRPLRILFTLVLLSLIMFLFTWVGNKIVVKSRGTRADFFAIWYGSQLTINHTNPYSQEATQVIHENLSGRPLGPGVYEHSFPYPAFIAVILFPFATLPYPTAFVAWTGIQLPLLFVALYLLIKFLDMELNRLEFAFLFIAGSIGFLFPLISYALGQISIFLLLLLASIFFLSKNLRIIEAGILLAFTAIRPDIFIIAGLSTIIIVRQSKRAIKHLVLSTIISIVVMNLLSTFLLGFWYFDWLNILSKYSSNNPKVHWPLEIFPSSVVQIGIVVMLIVYLFWQLFREFKEPTQSTKLLAISTLFMVYAIISKITGTYHMTLLLIPALIILSFYAQHKLQWIVLIALFLPWIYRFALTNINNGVWFNPFLVPSSFLILQIFYLLMAPNFVNTSRANTT